jgi:diacylglycerol kinase family enzyme
MATFVQVRVTYESGDVDRLVQEALALRSADTLVAAGGDGTINEVVAALLRHTGECAGQCVGVLGQLGLPGRG